VCRLWEWLKWWLRKRMKKSNGDVRVLGMVAGNHVLEDIGRDVPYRTLVVIPEAQALMSKDLWRAISQGAVYQLPSAPYPTGAPHNGSDQEKQRLEKYASELEARLARLQTENDALKRRLDGGSQTEAKLDEILKAVKDGLIKPVPASSYPGFPTAQEAKGVDETVDGSAPTFLPGEIKPKDLEARIQIEGEESTSDSVSEAADRLREMRKKKPKS
jgi:hypothetical protein